MPDWRAVTRSVAERVGIPPDLFERQIAQESGFDPNAGSPAGARGIAQIVPQYHPGVDPMNPVEALTYAARWMKELYGQYGNWRDALIHYNGGGGAIQRWRSGNPIAESVRYVAEILGPGKAEAAGPDEDLVYRGQPYESNEIPAARHDAAVQSVPLQATGGTAMASYGNPQLDKVVAAKGEPVNVKEINPTVDRIVAGEKVGETPNPTPTMRMTFADNTYLDVTFAGRTPNANASEVTGVTGPALASVARDEGKPRGQIVGSNTTDRYIVRQLPDGTLSRTPNPNYVPPKEAKPPNNKTVVTRNGKSYVYDPDTNTFTPATGLPDESPKRTTHTVGKRVYTVDDQGNVVGTTDLRTPTDVEAEGLGLQKTRLDIQKATQDLLPAQLRAMQGLDQTLAYLQGMYERGEMDFSQMNAYAQAYKDAALASVQGTTPFALKQAERAAAEARQRMGIDILNQRIATTGTIGSSLLSAASSLASRAMFRPGQTTVGFNPLADAGAFMAQQSQAAQADPLVASLLGGATAPPASPTGLPPGAPSGVVPVPLSGASGPNMPGALR